MATQYTAGLTAGQVLTAATMNQIGAAWETWTPTWTAATTNPVIGNGTIAGRYTRIQKLVVGQFRLTTGTTTTYGTGSWRFSFPITAKTPPSPYMSIGHGRLLDSSAGSYTICDCLYDVSNTSHFWILQGNVIANTTPFTWAYPDDLQVTIVYEAA